MKNASIARIRANYTALAPRLDEVVARFYQTLFREHPRLRAMFPQDMSRQQHHLAASLALVCRNIGHLDILDEPLMALGAAHAGFGVRPEQYPLVRDALIESIRHASEGAWTEQLHADWLEALNAVAAIMLKGAARAAWSAANDLTHETRGAGSSSHSNPSN
jgi:hemoglobin-like flavoprotein